MAVEKKKKDVAVSAEKTATEAQHTEQEENRDDILFETSETETETKLEKVKEEMVPMSFVEKMMAELEKKLESKILGKVKKQSNQQELDEDLDYARSLADDYMEEPAVFFAFSFTFAIHGDKRRGVEMEPPFGSIKFKPLIRSIKRGSRGPEVVSVSSVKIHSRSEAEWLRNHTQYGIAFFENVGKAMKVDVTLAQRMIEAQQAISRLSDMQVVSRAQQEGIQISSSVDDMRKKLVELTATRAYEKYDSIMYNNLRTKEIDKNTGRMIMKTV